MGVNVNKSNNNDIIADTYVDGDASIDDRNARSHAFA
jgi:hypothetical protein